MRYLALIVVPAGGLAALIAFIVVIAPGILALPLNRTPPEPVYFDHKVHVQTAGLECAFCHRTATNAASAGYPDVQQCMFCHSVITGTGNEQFQQEIDKVRQAWTAQRPIDWMRIHRMPDHVNFVHEAHLRAGFQCATCHGDVGNMGQVTQVRTLNMGDCVACHRQNGASAECATCHK